jgi:hypothetical protein
MGPGDRTEGGLTLYDAEHHELREEAREATAEDRAADPEGWQAWDELQDDVD